MARIHRYTKGNVTLSDTLVGTDVENQKATVNIPIAAIVDLAIDYFAVNGNGDDINYSLLDITTSLDGAITSIASYQNQVTVLTNEFESIVTRTERLESTFESDQDGVLTISAANITNFAETIAREGFAQATTLDTLSSRVQQIIDGQLALDTYATIEQLAQTTSTLQGSIATLQDTLTTGYQNYANGILQTDAFSQAVSGLVTEANGDFASATDFTNLKAQFGTFDANGNLTGLSSALADKVTNTISGEGYATASDLTTLEASLTTYIDGEIASSSTAGITGSQLTTVLAGYAEATALQSLQATVNGNTATLTQTASTVADINGKLLSSYGLNLTAGNAVAGMTFLADGQTNLSEIKFLADTFKIDRPNGAISPFIVNSDGTISLNGQVTFSNASTGQGIDFNDLSNYLNTNNYAKTSDIPDTSAFLDQAALAAYLQNNGYATGGTAGITEVQLLNILSGQNTTVNTVINGSNITTGIIASRDFQMPANSALSGFSVGGMGINLDNSSIHAEQFYINNDGTSSFKGSHSAGSVGNWTVDSSGALKDAASNPEIVLDPNGNYTEVGSEKLVLSSENLPAISPSAAVSANFNLSSTPMPNPVFGNTTTDASYRKTATTGYQSISEGTKRYKYSYPDFTGTVQGVSFIGNISYQSYTGGKFDYVIPYAAAPTSSPFIVWMGIQNGFGRDYGWAIAPNGTEFGDDTIGLNFNFIPNRPGVAGLDYKLKVRYRFDFVPDGANENDLETLVPILFTREKVLTSGTITKNLNEAIPEAQIVTPFANSIEYFGFKFEVPNNWSADQLSGSYTPTGPLANIGTTSNPGSIRVTAEYSYEITNIYIWAALVPSTSTGKYLTNSTSQPWAYTLFSPKNYLSSGPNLYQSFTNVLFTGSTGKTNIGLNGIQIRGQKGFVALGDNVSGEADSVAQFWGNAQVIGVLTSNASELFSDKNLKDNITPISNAISTVSKLAPVSFNWKPGMRSMDLGTRYGFIAQDVKEVLPTIVKEGEHLTLEHNNIISINTAAIKELIEKIEALEQEIQKLKGNNG